MPDEPPYSIAFASQVKEHLNAIELKYHASIRRKIDEQLLHEPDIPTRNRKPLRQPAPYGATWELRLGPSNRFRVLYQLEVDERQVQILAIGIKDGSRLLIGGEEIDL